MKQITYAPKYSVEPDGTVHGQRGILSPRDVGYHANGSSYQQVALYADRKRINKYVHVLVAEAYLDGHDPALQVNHIDGNKANNHVSNLENVSAQDNMIHAYEGDLLTGTHLGKNNPAPKFSKRLTRAQQERATTIPKGSTLK